MQEKELKAELKNLAISADPIVLVRPEFFEDRQKMAEIWKLLDQAKTELIATGRTSVTFPLGCELKILVRTE